MDNAVVDHETLQALYENVSIHILQRRAPVTGYNPNKYFQTSF